MELAHILIVEDDAICAEILEGALVEWGYSVVRADTGEGGLRAFDAGNIDLVVSDLGLPDISGTEVFEQIRARSPEMPVILLSADTDARQVLRAVHQGVDDFIAKSEHLSWLKAAIQHALDRLRLVRENHALVQRLHDMNAHLETEVADRTRKLELTNRQLKAEIEQRQRTETELLQAQKLEAMGQLGAGIAHEMAQPLNGIKIITQSLLRDLGHHGVDHAQLSLDLREIVGQVDKMADIIEHMLLYSRRSDHDGTQVLDLNRVVQDSMRLHRQHLLSRGIELQESYAEAALPVLGDAIRLEQVLVNLVSNAVLAVEGNGDRPRVVTLRTLARRDRGTLVVEVGDNGPGISEHVRSRVFDPFFTTRDPGKGTGLGLSVSRKIIEQHGGLLEFETELGEGTVFKLILPALDETEPNAEGGQA